MNGRANRQTDRQGKMREGMYAMQRIVCVWNGAVPVVRVGEC